MWTQLLLAVILIQGAEPKSVLDDPKFADVLRAFLAAPDSAPAREGLDQLLELYPRDPNGPMEVGRRLLIQRDAKRADPFLRRAAEMAPDASQTHFALGLCLLAEEEFDQSEKSFRRALELSPETPDIVYNLAQALGSQRKIDEAERLFRKAVELTPDRALFRFTLGEALKSTGKTAEAITVFQSAAELGKVRKYPDNPIARGRALYNLGDMSAQAGRLDEAPAYYEAAIAELPNDAEARARYGISLYRRKKYDQAMVQLRQAVQLGPRHRQANLHFALCLKQLGHEAEGETYLKRFKELQTEFEQTERENLLSKMQDNLRDLEGRTLPPSSKPGNKPENKNDK